MNENLYEVIQIDENTWSIEDGFVRFFLLKGTEKALMIDSGFDLEGVREIAENILRKAGVFEGQALELELLNTHGDGDHCFGNRDFDWFYLHPGDWALYRRQYGDAGEIRPVKEGDILDLGNRPLEIIEIPGHTFGSVAILDVNGRALFAGDSVQDGNIFLFGDHRNPDEFPAGLLKLESMDDRFDCIYASHDTLKLDPDYIGKVFDACEAVFHGEVEPEAREEHGTLVNAYDCGVATLLMDKDRVFEETDTEEE